MFGNLRGFVVRNFLSQISALLSVKLSRLKMCECKINDKYHVCSPLMYTDSNMNIIFQVPRWSRLGLQALWRGQLGGDCPRGDLRLCQGPLPPLLSSYCSTNLNWKVVWVILDGLGDSIDGTVDEISNFLYERLTAHGQTEVKLSQNCQQQKSGTA